MSTRVIKLKVLTATSVVTIVTNASTFGEFKTLPEVMALGINWTSAKLIDRATKASFELDDSVLPAIDCILFHTPTKSKAGLNWNEASYKDCKAEIKKLKDNGTYIPFNYTQSTTKDMQNFLGDYYSTTETCPSHESTEEMDEDVVNELISNIAMLLNDLKIEVAKRTAQAVVTPIDYVVNGVTMEDLEAEFAAIQKQLK